MYNWAVSNVDKIRFFFVTTQNIQDNASSFSLDQRFSDTKKVAGTRSHHSFIPQSSNKMEMRRVSGDDMYTSVYIGSDIEQSTSQQSHDEPATLPVDVNLYQPGRYIACVYDNRWYIGNIMQRNDEKQDVYVNFMKEHRGNKFSWPSENLKDQCWVPFQHILCHVEAPVIVDASGRRYKLTETDFKKVKDIFLKFKS